VNISVIEFNTMRVKISNLKCKSNSLWHVWRVDRLEYFVLCLVAVNTLEMCMVTA
jgi:hypothetical protein